MKIFNPILIIFFDFIFKGCSTINHPEKMKTEFSPAHDFLQIEEADPKYIIAKEPGLIIINGV